MKKLLKRLLRAFPYPLTRNEKYDRQTRDIIKEVVHNKSICVDVGCHKGEILDLIIQQSPDRYHFAFEPIPELYNHLREKYYDYCRVYDIALSNAVGETTFQHVLSNPSYSGLRQRKYARRKERIQEITVQTNKLDNLIPKNVKIDFIKIDVEGAEQWVLEGAREVIKRCYPIIIFEHGLGASEYYNSNPGDIFNILTECGLLVSTLDRWLDDHKNLTRDEFIEQYEKRLNYYFIAY